tara:strand:+ start:2875 stop:3648 length:774 start_codon:yes stop_codon:yes gene_type:complete
MVLKNEQYLRTYAPAVFATSPDSDRVSERYSFLPTTDVLEILQDEGWDVWKASQVKSRTWNKEHARHLIRLRHTDINMETFDAGDSFPEMLLMNCHNGLGSYQLRGGLFRMVCANGMVISEQDFGTINLRHIGFEASQVVAASTSLIENTTRMSDKINNWKSIELSPNEQQAFFIDAAELRFDSPSEDIIANVSTSRRREDDGTDLWRTFNRAQENIIRGGFRNEVTGRMVRPITNIQKDIQLNSELWDLAGAYSNN